MSIIKQGADLREIGFDDTKPFILSLRGALFATKQSPNDSIELHLEKILRIIPGRRIVALGIWQNKRIVAKIFFDKRHAARHMAAELNGIKLLQARNIPTAACLAEMRSADGAAWALINEQLNTDIDLSRAWRHVYMREELLPLLKALVVEIATQHVFGLMQKDLHLGNFLVANNVIYTLDGAQFVQHEGILPKKESMENLALFLAQLGVDARAYQEMLFRHYADNRGWLWKQRDVDELFDMIDHWNAERWSRYEKKIFRNSTHFQRFNNVYQEAVCVRQYCQSEFLTFLQQPEAVFQRPDALMLKNGRSSTVIQVRMDGRDYVIKRYNMKSIWHWLRRCLRTTRAKKCWRLTQKLNLFGVSTALPVAYIETKYMGLRGKSYFVMEYVRGKNIKQFLQEHAADQARCAKVIDQLQGIIAGFKKLGMSHGDLKATNILIDQHDNAVIIDLDGAEEHRTQMSLQRASKVDWQRFLQNFDAN